MCYQQPTYLLPEVAYDSPQTAQAGKNIFMPYSGHYIAGDGGVKHITSAYHYLSVLLFQTDINQAQTKYGRRATRQAPLMGVHAEKTLRKGR